MKILKIVTVISVLSLFVFGYLYQTTNVELNETKSLYNNELLSKDSIINHKDIEILELKEKVKEYQDTSNSENNKLREELKSIKSDFENFKLSSKFKYQKLVTEKTRIEDELIALKKLNEDLNDVVTDKNLSLKQQKKLIKKHELRIDSLLREINTPKEEEMMFIIEQPVDSIEVLPEIQLDNDIEEKDTKGKKKKKKKS